MSNLGGRVSLQGDPRHPKSGILEFWKGQTRTYRHAVQILRLKNSENANERYAVFFAKKDRSTTIVLKPETQGLKITHFSRGIRPTDVCYA